MEKGVGGRTNFLNRVLDSQATEDRSPGDNVGVVPGKFVTLTDGVITLRCLTVADAQAQLGGEDADQIKWLSGGAASLDGVTEWIDKNRSAWLSGGPRRNFGIYDSTGGLVGNAEAHLALQGLPDGSANFSYVVFPFTGGNCFARRAVNLVAQWLREDSQIKAVLIRIDPENVRRESPNYALTTRPLRL